MPGTNTKMKYKTENNEQMDTDGKKEEEKKTMIEETGEMFLCKNS